MKTVSAPAKINLSLRVLGKRKDGFHAIETRMAPISLADELTFDLAADAFRFSCSEDSLPTDESNLVVKAVRGLEYAAERELPVHIHLEKRVPHGAGLGGGSSDCATVLLELNELFELGLGFETLVGIAADLGSDIPFFLYQSVCDCTGRGEIVKPVAFEQELPLLLIKPAFGVETPSAYKNWRTSREIPDVDYTAQAFPWGELINDLERPVFQKHLVLAELKGWLRERPEVSGALMSGSGSTTMALLKDPELAESLKSAVLAEFGKTTWTCACHTLAS